MNDTNRWTNVGAGFWKARLLPATLVIAMSVSIFLRTPVKGDEGASFKNHPYFKHLLGGSWKMEGELKASDGRILKIKEEWKAQVLGENTLTMEGSREVEGDSKTFKWTITRDPSTGLFEATHQGDTNNPETQRFELQVPEDGSKVEMTALLGNGDAKLVIIESFKNGDHDQIESQVSLPDGSGTPALSGALLAKRSP